MKNTIILLFFVITNFCNAQMALIADKDGYVNVRKEGKVANNIIDKLKTGTMVYALEPASKNWDWTTIIYDNEKVGVVAFDRLKFIGNYPKLNKKAEKPNELILKSASFEITIKSKKFEAKNNKILKNKQGSIIKINNKMVVGTDGMLPQTEYAAITILHENKALHFPKSEYDNLYNVNLENTNAYYDDKEKTLYLEANNSDGAGYYVVVFVFKNGKFIEKKVVIPF